MQKKKTNKPTATTNNKQNTMYVCKEIKRSALNITDNDRVYTK